MFNNSTNIFIDTLASLQKLDDLERLVNPNSAFFQSYRNSMNEINLDCIEEELINYSSKEETGQNRKTPEEYRWKNCTLPSLECLPSMVVVTRSRRCSPSKDKENSTKFARAKIQSKSDEKPLNSARPGFKRLEPLVDQGQELKSMFSFQKNKNPNTDIQQPQTSNPGQTSKCTCANSRCLKLYCACFANGETCGPQCQCRSCYNNESSADIRKAIIEETLMKNPNAFKSKYKRHSQKDEILHVRGCNCSKTGCIKEYCECFKIGTGCSPLCHCVNCKNKKVELAAEEVKDYFVKAIRKRKKTKVYEENFGPAKKVSRRETIDEESHL